MSSLVNVWLSKDLSRRMTPEDRARITSAGKAPARQYVDGQGKRRCVGTADLKPTQPWPRADQFWLGARWLGKMKARRWLQGLEHGQGWDVCLCG